MSKAEKTRRELCWYYIAILFIVLPLFMIDKYFSISSEKWLFFVILSLAFIALTAICCILQKGFFAAFLLEFRNFGFTEYMALGLLAANTISLFYSVDMNESFLGLSSRHHGYLNMLIYVLLIFIIRSGSDRKGLCEALAFGGAIVSLTAVCQFLSFDPLGLYENITEESIHRMISTVGNMNIFSGYLNIVTPVTLYLFISAKRDSALFFYGLFVGLNFAAGVASTSDSFYLGVAASIFFMVVSGGLNRRQFRRFFAAVMIAAAADFALLYAARIISEKGIIFSHSLKEAGFAIRPLTGCTAFLDSHMWILGIIFGVAFIFWIFMSLISKEMKAEEMILRESDANLLTACFFITAICVVIYLISCYPFDENMGSYRGFIWNLAIDDFKDAGILRKIFGYGQETLLKLYHGRYRSVMLSTTGVVYDNVHCEPLQYLVTTGFLGLGTYVFLVIGVIGKLTARIKKQPDLYVLLLPILSYFVQSFVNIAQSATTPIFFVLIAIALGVCKKESKKKTAAE